MHNPLKLGSRMVGKSKRLTLAQNTFSAGFAKIILVFSLPVFVTLVICYHFTHDPSHLHNHNQRFPDIPTEIEFDQFGSADMMCLGAAPCGAAPFGGAPFGGIMVSDHCEARKLSFVHLYDINIH